MKWTTLPTPPGEEKCPREPASSISVLPATKSPLLHFALSEEEPVRSFFQDAPQRIEAERDPQQDELRQLLRAAREVLGEQEDGTAVQPDYEGQQDPGDHGYAQHHL